MAGLVDLSLAVDLYGADLDSEVDLDSGDLDAAGVSAAETANELVLDYLLKLIRIDAGMLFMNPQFRLVLEPEFKDICSATPLAFPQCLFETLSSKSPPNIDFFLNLPVAMRGSWAIYAVVLVDVTGNYSVYIGSGTGIEAKGCLRRTEHYLDKKHHKLPRFVREAYDEGAELAHVGILCWCRLPKPALVPRARLLFLALEALFTCFFFASRRFADSDWAHLFPWTRDMISWSPLCTHLSLVEGSHDLEMTPEQLEKAAAMRVVKMAENSKAAEKRERENDLEAHLLRKRTEKSAYIKNNADKVAGWYEKSVAKIKAARKHYCQDCNYAFASITMLQKHLESKKHRDQVALNAGGPPKPPSANAIRSRRSVEKVKAEKRFYCSLCDVNFPCQAKLDIHYNTKRHKKKAAALKPLVSV